MEKVSWMTPIKLQLKRQKVRVLRYYVIFIRARKFFSTCLNMSKSLKKKTVLEIVLTHFCRYCDMSKGFLNVEWLCMDSAILLPPTGTPMTGIDFTKRLPCGEVCFIWYLLLHAIKLLLNWRWREQEERYVCSSWYVMLC